MQTKTSVSSKNTKQEIWNAYQELLAQQKETTLPSLPKKLMTTNNQLKNLLSNLTNELTTTLAEKVAEINSQFDEATRTLEQLNQLHNSQTQTLALEKAEAQKTRQREEEEYSYEFAKLKKRQAEELAELKQKIETELTAKRADLKLQEDELKELRQKVGTFEAELNQAVKEAVAKATAELTREFNHQKALAEQQTQAKVQLLEQKVGSLENTIKNYQAEIALLQTSLKETHQQLTRIAERAVEKSPLVTSQTKE